ncbi:VraH family protein [Staphylococcus sp. SQ8-PEA]|uniref:VraH family protein n=1 Tax=Staphylococcus marylandisciuri TaxID=2981529 RepID=A0ABT2QSN7_9STAP|nr:VraH family protein [Staphylococcus marylandisciuri]MCU5746975.1 VraH family protein [Staphylococcus marylandisciuri]
MNFKEMYYYLMNKQWETDELVWFILSMVVGSMVITPIIGVPAGAIFYLYCIDKDFKDRDH